MISPNYHMVHAQPYPFEQQGRTSLLLTVLHTLTPCPISDLSLHKSSWPAVYHTA